MSKKCLLILIQKIEIANFEKKWNLKENISQYYLKKVVIYTLAQTNQHYVIVFPNWNGGNPIKIWITINRFAEIPQHIWIWKSQRSIYKNGLSIYNLFPSLSILIWVPKCTDRACGQFCQVKTATLSGRKFTAPQNGGRIRTQLIFPVISIY